MSMIFLAKGTCTMGMTRRDKDGNVVEESSAQFTFDDAGGSVAIGEMNPNTMEINKESVSIFGDWDAAGYMAKALELLKPKRAVNIPDLKAIVQAAYHDYGKDFLCDYCANMNCRDCIIKEWMEELE